MYPLRRRATRKNPRHVRHHTNWIRPRTCATVGIVLTATLISGCGGAEEMPQSTPLPHFQSGFEAGTEVRSLQPEGNCTADIVGLDTSVPSRGHWETDLEASPVGLARVCFAGGTSEQRGVELIEESDGNRALRMWLREPGENISDDDVACNDDPVGARKARAQHALTNLDDVTHAIYRARVRLGDTFQLLEDDVDQAETITWMTLGEYWNEQAPATGETKGDRARVTLTLLKKMEETGDRRFHLAVASELQPASQPSGWDSQLPGEYGIILDDPVPIGEWFTLEVNLRASDGPDDTPGGVTLSMEYDGRVTSGGFEGDTIVPGGAVPGFTTLHLLKLYTAGGYVCALRDQGGLEVFWDDLQVWLDP